MQKRYKTKVCTHCKRRRKMRGFYAHPLAKDKKDSWCKICRKGRSEDRWYKMPKVEQRRTRLKRDYNLSLEGFDALSRAQGHRCAICNGAKKLQVDHDHATGKVRGLLCGTCNRALGMLHDDIPAVEGAVAYLKRFKIATT